MRLLMLTPMLLALLSSCQHSPQKKYYLLTPLENDQKSIIGASNNSSANIASTIGIGPIEVPDYLHRLQIVSTPSGDTQNRNTLTLSDTHYWAEPLDKGVARVIMLNLTQQNSNRGFVYFPWRSDAKPRYSLRIRISSLTCTSNDANIVADWELMDNDALSHLQRHRFIRTLPSSVGALALAKVYSQLLADLSAEMDEALQSVEVAAGQH